MITYGGERVTLETGAPTINTIGVSLGRIMRFCGHTERPYSVLAHSLVTAELVPPKFGIYALMHDAQESLMSDVPTPMKSQVARNREYKLLERIYITNGLPWPIPEEAQEAVDEADETALIAEAHILGHPAAVYFWGEEYDEVAGMLTKKYAKKTVEWLEASVSGPLFVKKFKTYVSLAGLDAIEAWA